MGLSAVLHAQLGDSLEGYFRFEVSLIVLKAQKSSQLSHDSVGGTLNLIKEMVESLDIFQFVRNGLIAV